MAFDQLKKLAKKVQKIKEESLIIALAKDSILKAEIIDLNTQGQLFERGIDSTGANLGQYSAFTRAIKTNKGQRIDHVTLKDTGEFYKSFKVVRSGEDLQIKANTIKEDNDLIQVWGKDILGLTEESLQEIRPAVKDISIETIRRQLDV